MCYNHGLQIRAIGIESPIYGLNRLDARSDKQWGGWINGKAYSSPLYIGINYGNRTERIGYSHNIFQKGTQNLWHRMLGLPQFSDYEFFYEGPYLYNGYTNPFSLWGK